MSKQLTTVFEDWVADEIGVVAEWSEVGRVNLTLTFHAGLSYCCAEPGCHLGLHTAEDWKKIRPRLEECSSDETAQYVIDLNGVIEDGAILESSAKFEKNGTSEAYSYQHRYEEPIGG